MIIRMTDLRRHGVCFDGARAFADRYGIDWVDFLRNGIDSDVLLALDNAMITKAVNAIVRDAYGQQ